MGLKLKDEGNGYSNLTNSSNDAFREDDFSQVGNKEFDVNDIFKETTFKDVSASVKTSSASVGSSGINWKQIILLVTACIMLFSGISSIRRYKDEKKIIEAGLTTDAIVSRVEYRHRKKSRSVYRIYIDYEVNGISYNDIYLRTSSYREVTGRHYTVYYKESNPRKITTVELRDAANRNIYIYFSLALIIAVISFFVKPDKDDTDDTDGKSIDVLLAEKRNNRRNRW